MPAAATPSGMRRHLDDTFVGLGLTLGGIGVYTLWPVGVWFYSGAVCVLIGVVLGRVR